MKQKFEALISNNTSRTILTVIITAVVVIATIGIGSAIASDGNSVEEKVVAIGKEKLSTTNAAVEENTVVPTATKEEVPSNTSSSNSTHNDSSSNGNYIGESKAKKIAINKSGGGEVVQCHLDHDDGRAEYEVEVINGKYEYDFEINARTGDIIELDKELLDQYENEHDHDDYYDNNHYDDYDDDYHHYDD
jgi:uncharacterized membrane protein YkoI